MKNKISIILISFILMFFILSSSTLKAFGAISYGDSLFITKDSQRFSGSSMTKYMRLLFKLDELGGGNTTITLQFLLDNPTYGFVIDYDDDSISSKFIFESSFGGINSVQISSGSVITIESFKQDTTFWNWVNTSSYSDCLAKALAFVPTVVGDGNIYAVISEIDDGTTDDGTTDDGTTGENTGMTDEDKGFFSDTFDKLESFFSELFSPITEFFESIKEQNETKNNFWTTISDFLEDLIEKIKGFTFDPVLEFLANLDVSAIATMMEIFDFPVIKEMTVAVASILVFVGFISLLLTF